MKLVVPFEIGSPVEIDHDETFGGGYVLAYTWRGSGIQAEVAWLHNGEARSAWFDLWRLSVPE